MHASVIAANGSVSLPARCYRSVFGQAVYTAQTLRPMTISHSSL
jgi:hypothetical protein